MNRFWIPLLTIGLLAGVAHPAQAAIVYSNVGIAPGDFYVNPLSFNQGQAVGTTGWYYNNVRNSAGVGINVAYPRSGDGSVLFRSPSGAGKADIEYLANAINLGGNYVAAGSLGRFADFVGMSYEWYRSSSSTNPSAQHPSLRILLDADGNLLTTGDRGGLVFERGYNTPSVVPTDTWVADSIGSSTYVWNFGLGIGTLADIDLTSNPYDQTLAQWQAYFPNAVILGFSSGVGSGWNGVFEGAVDNIGWRIGNQSFNFNFEVAVPEPATWAVVGVGLAGLALRRRRD
jgi:hypothetical protein